MNSSSVWSTYFLSQFLDLCEMFLVFGIQNPILNSKIQNSSSKIQKSVARCRFCAQPSFVIGFSWLCKGKPKREIIDSGAFWVYLRLDLTIICRFTESFLFYFVVKVLPDKFLEREKSGRNFHLKDDFLMSVSVERCWHKTIFKETKKPSWLLCLFIRSHEQPYSEGIEVSFQKM